MFLQRVSGTQSILIAALNIFRLEGLFLRLFRLCCRKVKVFGCSELIFDFFYLVACLFCITSGAKHSFAFASSVDFDLFWVIVGRFYPKNGKKCWLELFNITNDNSFVWLLFPNNCASGNLKFYKTRQNIFKISKKIFQSFSKKRRLYSSVVSFYFKILFQPCTMFNNSACMSV